MSRPLLVLAALTVVLSSCQDPSEETSPPRFSISPDKAIQGSPDLTLNILGSGFAGVGHVSSHVVWVVGSDTTYLAATFVNAEQLTGVVPEALMASPVRAQVSVLVGDLMADVPVLKRLGTAAFTVTSTGTGTPLGSLITISPTTAAVGTGGLTLTVTGGGFATPGHHVRSQVMWAANGDTTALATMPVSSSRLTAEIPAELLQLADTAHVFVLTGDPMSDLPPAQTTSAPFIVTDLISVSPTTAVVGNPDMTLTVKGAGFSNSPDSLSEVLWVRGDTVPLATTFVSSTELEAIAPAALLKADVVVLLCVRTQTRAGGGPPRYSNSVTFEILPLPPGFGFSPTSVGAGSPSITLTISGAGFRDSHIFYTQALWVVGRDTTHLATRFVSPYELTAVVPPDRLRVPGTAQVLLESGDHIEGLLHRFPIGSFTVR